MMKTLGQFFLMCGAGVGLGAAAFVSVQLLQQLMFLLETNDTAFAIVGILILLAFIFAVRK